MHTITSWLAKHSGLSDCFGEPIQTTSLNKLLCECLNINTAWLITHQNHELSKLELKTLDKQAAQLRHGIPLAYIIGKQPFWDFEVIVNQHTLIPRPDTECLIDLCINLFNPQPPERILDLGTGSGVIAIALSRIFNSAEITAVDHSAAALEVAKENAKINQAERIKFIQSDWFTQVDQQTAFDLIISNPPYISKNDAHLDKLQHEPMTALVAEQNGLADYKKITASASAYLKPKGVLMFEHGWQQKSAVQKIMQDAGFQGIKTFKDLAGHDRATIANKP